MSTESQSLKNHARFDPYFHGLTFLVYLANLIFASAHFYRHREIAPAWYLFLSLIAIVPIFILRTYPLKVQDRIIRLEERLRLQALAPSEWHAQIYKLTEDQLIGLRFASDDEVVELAKQALEHNLNRKQIKERIKNWRADNWRI
ncbi:MAG TPA: DUF6526 family protein [Terracidiphilus sp.]|jgi:hypothetical protein|nr:DUF6526 family protein [Terracidiphilus sp.]